MKIGTQNQQYFPDSIERKFAYLRSAGFDAFEVDGRLLVSRLPEIKQAIESTGLPVATACGGYRGWIGDFDEQRRLSAIEDIKQILEALAEVDGKGIVVPAAWGMGSYRLPPMTPSRSSEDDWETVSRSLLELDRAAADTGTRIYLEPLNRYQDHMINTLAQARRYIEENGLQHVGIVADFYHMNIEEDDVCAALHQHRDLIEHVHIADNQRYQPGSGALDFRRCFEQLKADGYSGYLTLECRIRGDEPQVMYEQSLAFLRNQLLETMA